MSILNHFYLGVLLVFLSAAGFGLIPIFALYAYGGGASVTTLLFGRFALAAIFFLSYLLYKERKISVQRSQLKYLFLMGGVIYTLQSYLYLSSVKYIPASLAVLVFYIYPVFVAVLSSFLDKEELHKKIIFSIVLSLVGLTLVLGISFGDINLTGVMLAFGAGLVYSAYLVLGNRVVKETSAMVTSAFVCLSAATSIFVIGISTGALDFNLTREAWLAILGVALCCTVLAIFTLFRGIELIGSTKASILSMIEPLITIGFSAALFNERLSLLQMMGGVAVLAGAVLVISARDRSETTTKSVSPAKGAKIQKYKNF
ncbi:Threonine/homoserine efflux transporter RhtA [Desulforamulus aeronauticus DSM 10349]|uniref:Threonine/homoserine efflux transporter RhtA n=1 Tax=Desulforamulus aeronauticus DSM 10349 TaxID=1121421 RepID=A0A1M6S6M9_9FIRM|nr:Threonine/homoserine efflux transporter RhtA [Desulforamulus aeronauticus DSM 10349]